MNKTEQAARVKALCEYLAGIGQPISRVQGYEVLARAHGHKNKHVLADASRGKPARKGNGTAAVPASVLVDGETVPVMASGSKPFTYAAMVALDWEFDVVIPVPLEKLEIDALNEYASEFITGNDCALENIGYTHVPEVNYGRDVIAYRVTGEVSSPEDFFEEAQDENDRRFYADLQELVDVLVPGPVVIEQDDVRREAMVVSLYSLSAKPGESPLGLLAEYARSHGANNDQVNEHGAEVVATLGRVVCPGETEIDVDLRLSDLKYAVKVAPRTWFVCVRSRTTLKLQFLAP
jgi:hypothetical protein